MDKFIWTDEYSVGIKSIDEQHRHFFEIVNSIIDLAGKEDISKDDLLASLGELGDYALYHFGNEEGYFDKFGYEEAPQHIAEHNQYREKIKEYFNKVQGGGADVKELAGEISSYPGGWLVNHILLVDKKYTKFLKDHGVE